MVSNFYPVWKCSGFQDFLLIQIKLYLKKKMTVTYLNKVIFVVSFTRSNTCLYKTMYTKNEKETH